jgi:hypothetical protein
MAGKDFYRFEPEETLSTYAMAREAMQFLTDNYWKQIGDEAAKALVLPGSTVERNFHYSLMQAISGTKIALERWPEDSELKKILPIFERTLPKIGHTETLGIELLYGNDLRRLHSNIGDFPAEELLISARGVLDALIDTRDKVFAGAVYRMYSYYHEYICELVKIYDGKREALDSRDPDALLPGTTGKKRISELYERQSDRLEELWFSGLIDGEDYRLFQNDV